MALPQKIQVNAITGSSLPSTIDGDINAGVKQPVIDIFGIPNNTDISNAITEVVADGLKNVRFRDTLANPATAGYLQRNSAVLNFHDGTASRALVGRDSTDTLSNKTFVSPTVTTGPITLTSGQVAYPATQVGTSDANTLDDYEEGTWTPSVGGSATYTTQLGHYTKVGRSVTVVFHLTIASIGTGSTFQISGLPFTALSISGMVGGVYWDTLSTNVVTVIGLVPPASSDIQLWSALAASDDVDLLDVLGNGSTVRGTIHYLVSSV